MRLAPVAADGHDGGMASAATTPMAVTWSVPALCSRCGLPPVTADEIAAWRRGERQGEKTENRCWASSPESELLVTDEEMKMDAEKLLRALDRARRDVAVDVCVVKYCRPWVELNCRD